MRRLLAALALALLLPSLSWAVAAGSIVTTQTDVGAGYTRYDFVWTSSAGGAVSGNTLSIKRGRMIQAEFVPGTAGVQPTNLYSAVFNDPNGVDLLITAGASLSNSTSKIIQFWPPFYYDTVGALDLVISNAGNAKSGTFTLLVGP